MKLAIIILVYNTKPEYLKECLDSIYSSTFQDFIIILVNDGSTVKYPFLDRDRLIVLTNSENKGIPYSCNLAFNYVKENYPNSYAVRVDSDDKVSPSLFEKEVSFLDSHLDHIAVCTNLKHFGLKETVIKRPSVWSLSRAKYLYHGYGYAPTMMFRASALDKAMCDERYHICEDFDFHLKLLKQGKIASIQEDDLYFKRSHPTQITRLVFNDVRRKLIRQIIEEHLGEPKKLII